MPSPYDTPRRVNPAGRGLGRCGPVDGSGPGQHPFCRSRASVRDLRRICLRAGLRRAGRAGPEDRGRDTRPREAPITFLREEPAISQRRSPTRPDRRIFCTGWHRRRLRSAISVFPPLRLWGSSASRLGSWATKSGKGRPQRAIGTCTHDPRRTSSRQKRSSSNPAMNSIHFNA